MRDEHRTEQRRTDHDRGQLGAQQARLVAYPSHDQRQEHRHDKQLPDVGGLREHLGEPGIGVYHRPERALRQPTVAVRDP